MNPADPRLALRPNSAVPFAALDADWALLCRQHRRSVVVARWTRREPALAGVRRLGDVIPPPGVERSPFCRALAHLAAERDALAARALLQLLVPGLVRLASRWASELGGVANAGYEVLGRAAVYIGHLQEIDLGCSPAGYVLGSIERDLVDERRQGRVHRRELGWGDLGDDRAVELATSGPSAEDTAMDGSMLWDALTGAARRGEIGQLSARLLCLGAAGHQMPEVAARIGIHPKSAYRIRSDGAARLRQRLAAAS